MPTVHRLGSRPMVTWLAMAAVSLSATIWTAPAAAQPQKETVEFTVDVAEDFALFGLYPSQLGAFMNITRLAKFAGLIVSVAGEIYV